MFLYIKTNILRGYGIFKNDFAHPREPATTVQYYSPTTCRSSAFSDSEDVDYRID